MDPKTEPVRIRLEPFAEADEALYDRLVFNDQVMKMNLGRVFTEEEARLFFSAILEMNRENACPGYFKVLGADGSFLGLGGVTDGEEEGAAEAEYMLLPEYWRQGYGTRLLSELLALAAARGYTWIAAITDPGNIASRGLLDKARFLLEKEYINEDGEPALRYGRTL